MVVSEALGVGLLAVGRHAEHGRVADVCVDVREERAAAEPDALAMTAASVVLAVGVRTSRRRTHQHPAAPRKITRRQL